MALRHMPGEGHSLSLNSTVPCRRLNHVPQRHPGPNLDRMSLHPCSPSVGKRDLEDVIMLRILRWGDCLAYPRGT